MTGSGTIKGLRRHRHRGNLRRQLPLISAVVPTERERAAFVRPVGGVGWFMPCPLDRTAPLLGY